MAKRRFRLSVFGLILLGLHTVLVLCMLLIIALGWHGGGGSGEIAMAWYAIDRLDFPSSWLAFETEHLLDALTGDRLGPTAVNVYVPALMFGFWGGIQYYLIGAGVAALARVLFGSSRGHDNHHCRKCGYDLRGNRSGRCPECGQPVANSRT